MKENDGCSGTAVAPRSLMSSSGTFKFNPSYSASAAKTNVDLSTSLSDEGGRSSTSSCQHGDRRQEKLILLKRSVQYTTQLKSDTMTMTNEETPNSLQCKDIESDEITDCNDPTSSPSMFDISTTRPSHPFQENTSSAMTSKPVLDGAYDLFSIPTEFSSTSSQIFLSKTLKFKNEKDMDILERRSSISKFDLSSSWLSHLSKDTASTSSICSDQFDGAYDLFSLPSDSSISPSRCDSNRSLDNIIGVDRLSLHDDISECTIPKHRKVSFDSTVKATTIPSRLSYSSRMKTRLWSSTEDIYSNAIRNEKEFAFDGSDWRTATEECDFLRCPFVSSMLSDDVLVHPVHFASLRSSQTYLHQKQVATLQNANGKESVAEIKEVVDTHTDASQFDDGSGGIFDMD